MPPARRRRASRRFGRRASLMVNVSKVEASIDAALSLREDEERVLAQRHGALVAPRKYSLKERHHAIRIQTLHGVGTRAGMADSGHLVSR